MEQRKIHTDSREIDQPAGTYRHGKNGIMSESGKAVFNEPGFKKMQTVIPYSFIGVIETDYFPVILSTNNVNSAIGFFDNVNDIYIPVIDDILAGTDKLNFNTQYYITGISERNYKGELLIVFTDKFNVPRIINLSTANSATPVDDYKLFPSFKDPKITLTENSGGILGKGTYYVCLQYENNDGTLTSRSEVSKGITLSANTFNAALKSKAIDIKVENIDSRYDFVVFTIISRTDNATNAVELTVPIPIVGNSVYYTYSGYEVNQQVSLTSVLTDKAEYSIADTVTQLNGKLYLGNLKKSPDFNDLQQYANLVRVKWNSSLVDAVYPTPQELDGRKKGFMHEEVFALYIQYHKTAGGYTKAMTVPGIPVLPYMEVLSDEAATGGGGYIEKFRVEDTIPAFDLGTLSGTPGAWKNATEVYPDTIDFDSSTLGGRNLRNQPVLHHKMPSIRWCKQNLYNTVTEYGKTKLDMLGLSFENISIPSKYIGLIDGYRLLYAKRDSSNMTVIGQGLLMHSVVSQGEASLQTIDAIKYTSGGNWTSGVLNAGKGDYDTNWELTQLKRDTIRFHSFDLLFNRPGINPEYISGQLKLRKQNLRAEGFLEDGADNGENNMPTSHLIDYTTSIVPVAQSAGRYLRYIKTGFYLDNGFSLAKFNNVKHENCWAGLLSGTNWPLNWGDMRFRTRGGATTGAGNTADFEETYLINLLSPKQNVYLNFYSQELVSAGDYVPLTSNEVFYGGDTFVSDYTFHTYGRHDAIDSGGEGFKGKKVIRRFVCESTSNINIRYELPGNEYSKWYPKTGVTPNSPQNCYITLLDRSKDPNQFGYTKDLGALNNFIKQSIFNPFVEDITEFPNRIHRGGMFNRENKPRSWRTFLPLDYYEVKRDKGPISNLESKDDRLLIHLENALMITQDKTKLEADDLQVTLGTADIFQYEPQEARDSKLGYAGTRHDLAAIKTPAGYIFPDAAQGEMFLLNEKLEWLNAGINQFLSEYLKVNEKNPYFGNGITVGWDQKYKRLLLTVKNKKAAPQIIIKEFSNTQEFFNQLSVGDIVNYNGRLIEYKGLNNPVQSGFECDLGVTPNEYEWREYEFSCEQEDLINNITPPVLFDNLYSPTALLYDNVSMKLYVADKDNPTGNIYEINTTDGTKVVVPGVSSPMLFAKKSNTLFFMAGNASGMVIFDSVSGTYTVTPYGSNTLGSRRNAWAVNDVIIAESISEGRLYFIDRITRNIVRNILINVDIPSAATYFSGEYNLYSNGYVFCVASLRASSTVGVYSEDLLSLVDTIDLVGSIALSGNFQQTSFMYNEILYIADHGSNTLFLVDTVDMSVKNTNPIILDAGTVTYKIIFSIDPVNDSMYMGVDAYDAGNTIIGSSLYILDKNTGNTITSYSETRVYEGYTREHLRDIMWAPIAGISGTSTDGKLLKFSHGITVTPT